jgi:TatA/E family protein of Tat protein translocase
LFGIGGFELVLILLFAFLVFGPDKLPEIARTLGELIAKFRSAQEEVNDVIKKEVLQEEPKAQPARNSRRNVGKPDPSRTNRNTASTASEKPAAGTKVKAADAQQDEAPRKETFAERKARYDRERQEAARAEMRAAATEHAKAEEAAEAAATAAASVTKPAPAAATKPAPTKPRPTAAELYGTVPMKPKPRAAKPAPVEDAVAEGEGE